MSRDKHTEIHKLAKKMSEAISTEVERRYIEDEAKLEAVFRANGWVKAEEIFAEIEETFKECLWFLENHPSDYPRMDRTKINVYKDNLQYIAEIKNKYKGE